MDISPAVESLIRPLAPTRLMATINASPESFFKGSVAQAQDEVAAAARRAEQAGAALLDIGAMSTAPYKKTYVSAAEEKARLLDAIAAASEATMLPISADTQRASVAEAALEAGAAIINDVSGLRADPAMAPLIAAAGAGVVLMANDDPALEEAGRTPAEIVADLLDEALQRAAAAGIPHGRVILDPGFGFFRHRSIPWYAFDMAILQATPALQQRFARPLLVGVSRKSFFGQVLGRKTPEDRLAGSLAVAAWCADRGVSWLRVHDAQETADVLRMIELMNGNFPEP